MKDSTGTDNRREMREIRDLVPRRELAGIAAALRSMKRLWEGKGLNGLLRRREAEAVLVESCVAPPALVARAVPRKRAAPKKRAAKAGPRRKTKQ